MTLRATRVVVGLLLLLLPLTACQAQKSANPLSPAIAGPISGVSISAPGLLQPTQGFKFKDTQQPIQLVVQNATTTGVRPLSYTFDVATDAAFSNKVFSRAGVAPGDGKTTVQIDMLPIGQSYFWRARAEDGANTGDFASAAFDIFPKAAVNPPAAIAPINNAVAASTTPALTVSDASIVGPVGPLTYEFQVASDQAFSQLVAAGIIAEGAGQTTFHSSALAASATFFWRVRASDGQTTSNWSGVQAFRTPAAPAPGPTPNPTPGAACVSSDPLTLIACQRNKFGHMTANDEFNFLVAAAKSLTSNGIPGGPFGLLRKTGGTNCNGFSCDIICSGQNSSQKQWDVLGDADPWPGGGAQTPSWNGPSTVPNIRTDVCSIQ
jgi:hypothetical protein